MPVSAEFHCTEGLDVIRKEAWLSYRTNSHVRLYWELEGAKGPQKGRLPRRAKRGQEGAHRADSRYSKTSDSAPRSLRPRNLNRDGFLFADAFLRAKSQREGQASWKDRFRGEITWTDLAVVRKESEGRAGIGAAWWQTRVRSELCAPRARALRRTRSVCG